MRKKWFVYALTVCMALCVCGCGKAPDSKEETAETTEESSNNSEKPDSAEDNKEENEESANVPDEGNAEDLKTGNGEGEDTDIPLESGMVEGKSGDFSHGEISLTFPQAWDGKFYIEKYETGFTVYQKASYDIHEFMGFLFSVSFSEEPYYDYPAGGMVAYTENKAYYVLYPTDVPFATEVESIGTEYMEMCKYLEEIEFSIRISGDGVHYNADEFILPMSEYYQLTEMDVINLSPTQLWFARNEIYARHGYHFNNEYLQACFERCSWYEDKGENYYTTALTEIDLANIATIKAMEEQKASLYPMELETGEDHAVDLNRDGHNELVRVDVKVINEYDNMATITVEGVEYSLEDMGVYAFNLHAEDFYITDISPHFTGYEIAIADYGPSSDCVTHFFTYDNELHYIGAVEGFPMPQLNYVNGFGSGNLIGRRRSDLLGTNYGYGSWWYDYTNGKLILQDTGAFYLEPWYSHKLLVDLPVYISQNTESQTYIMDADQIVYFLRSDGKEWVQIRDQNGTEGWVYVKSFSIENVGLGMDSVFEGIQFFD